VSAEREALSKKIEEWNAHIGKALDVSAQTRR
jgi:hypothetical protein